MRSTSIGLAGGTMFALSAISYRGAILSLGLPDFVLAATFTVTVGLVIQAALLSAFLALRDPGVLRAIARAWKPSLFAGFMGAFASEFWFLAFAITTAANVRTLALVEVLVRTGRDAFRLQTAHHTARGYRHRAGGDRRRPIGLGVLIPLVRKRRQRMKFDAFLRELFGLFR